MKKLFKLMSVIAIIILITCHNVSAATLYAPDGRTISVADEDADKWCSVGWYNTPVTTMFAPDGRSIVVAASDATLWKNVGWYEFPVTTMYSFDGRTVVVSSSDINLWENVGWYSQKTDIYRQIADMVISADCGYEFAKYVGLKYSCEDMGAYYLFIGRSTRNADGSIWYKVYKNNLYLEKIFEGSCYNDVPYVQYVSENYNFTEYWF